MIAPSGYLICGTPRTGSTLLCSLLASTEVLGRPESYFREPDEAEWARRFNLPVSAGRVRDYRAFVAAVRAEATTANGIFAARIMWGSLERVAEGLAKPSAEADLATLERAFGRLAFMYLVREDVSCQAVSWARAEQTGYWQQGDIASRRAHFDLGQTTALVHTIHEHNAAWRTWFADNGVQPYRITYDELVHEPAKTVERIAARLAVDLPVEWQPASPHRKQADATSAEWTDRLRAALSAEAR